MFVNWQATAGRWYKAKHKATRMMMPSDPRCSLDPDLALPAFGQEARRRWEMERQIRLDKFEQILPGAMRNAGIDMWIVAVKENHYDPLWKDMGRGYISGIGYYVFTDRGRERIERAALGPGGYLIEQSGAYDIFAAACTLAAFVRERNPKRIGVNMSDEIGPADGLSHTMHQHLREDAGRALCVAARQRGAAGVRVPIASRRQRDRGLWRSCRDRHPIGRTRALQRGHHGGKSTLEDVAWWMQDRLLERGLGSEFDMPSVYITGPQGIAATSTDRIIQPGDVIMIDWGVQLMNFGTDVKRVAYVLKAGEIVAARRAFRMRSTRRSPSATCSSARSSRVCAPTRR